ncbi:MAG: helix-turn-helix domain-containing protein [Spiribacter salinus]|uniref:Helix-turn-helix domain-containing protein n=1 Tax=Spiribacter salinus TaxID=1335746 RepID=A0A540V322_9GAMM|nr:MAG: helix-turn-helix domain-containing protein [Spiribacter salinus]
MSPDPSEIRAARLAAGLTQRQAGELIGGTLRTWQDWEYGRRNMPSAKWELFVIKTGQSEARSG